MNRSLLERCFEEQEIQLDLSANARLDECPLEEVLMPFIRNSESPGHEESSRGSYSKEKIKEDYDDDIPF